MWYGCRLYASAGNLLTFVSFGEKNMGVRVICGYNLENTVPMPKTIATKISKLIWEFIWSGKTELLTHNLCVQPREMGRMDIVHIQLKLKAL